MAYSTTAADEVSMTLEQAELVVEADERSMAADVMVFVQQATDFAEQVTQSCQ